MAQHAALPERAAEIPAVEEIDHLLEQVALLARSDRPAAEFHAALLAQAVRALGAAGGAVWLADSEGNFSLVAQGGAAADFERLSDHRGHRALLGEVARDKGSRIVPPGSGGTGEVQNPLPCALLLAPVLPEGALGAAAILEVLCPGGTAEAAQHGCLEVLEALCGLAAEFHHRERLRALQEAQARHTLFARFAESIHASLEPQATAFAMANDGRLYIGCDRLTVLLRRRGRYQVAAVSGVDVVDHRAGLVAAMPPLAQAVAATGRDLWVQEAGGDLPPQIARPLLRFLDLSGSRAIGVLPLCEGPPQPAVAAARLPLGVLLVETFGASPELPALRERCQAAARQARLALANCRVHHGLPMFAVVHALGRLRDRLGERSLPRGLGAIAALALAAALLMTVRADFTVTARGTLEPQQRRNVFAPADGLVRDVRVEHLDRCRQGDLLVVLERPQLEFDWARVTGELSTARQRLTSLEASRLQGEPRGAAQRERQTALSAEEEETRVLVAGLERQQAMLRAQREALEVRSPLSGLVISFDVARRLSGRPVARGQALLQVADPDGPWQLELDVPDEEMGVVLQAQRDLGAPLEVVFAMATDPEKLYRGTITEIAHASRLERGQSVVRVTVALDAQRLADRRPGATVLDRIVCGRRPLGTVWFHGIWRTICKQVLF